MSEDLFTVRDGNSSDENFIFASWLRGLYYGNSWFREVNKDVFMDAYHRVIEFILKSTNTKVKVCCLKDDPEVILGYAVFGANDTLHWIFVKSIWRMRGVAKALVPAPVRRVTHLTKTGLTIMRRRPNVSFDPFNIN